MSDNGEVEVENPSGYQVLPKEVTDEIGTIKLFNKWAYDDVEVRDISLTSVTHLPHSPSPTRKVLWSLNSGRTLHLAIYPLELARLTSNPSFSL